MLLVIYLAGWMMLIIFHKCYAVSALKAIRSNLVDPMFKLNTWNSGDPCTSNWTGVICYNSTFGDGYLHIEEL